MEISKKNINHMIDVVNKSFHNMPSAVTTGGSMNELFGVSLAVYMKTRNFYLMKLFDEVQVPYDKNDFLTNYHSYNGYIRVGDSYMSIEDAYFEEFMDYVFIEPKTPFWRDGFSIDSGYENASDLTEFYFSEKGVEEFFPENISLCREDFEREELIIPKKVTKEWCEKNIPHAYSDVKNWWLSPYQEEMALAIIPNLRLFFEYNFSDEGSWYYKFNVNVAIVPFLNALSSNRALRSDKASKFALTLIKELKYCQAYQPWAMGGFSYCYTKKLFCNIQGLGTGYEDGLSNCSLDVKAYVAFYLIDYVLIYLDMKYDFLSDDIKTFYQNRKDITKGEL